MQVLRLGCELYALDLNSVTRCIGLCTLVDPEQFGAPDSRAAGSAGLSLGQARTLLSALAAAEIERDRRLRELRSRYETEPPTPEVHLRWQELAGRVAVRSTQELDNILARLKERIAAKLGGDVTVIIE